MGLYFISFSSSWPDALSTFFFVPTHSNLDDTWTRRNAERRFARALPSAAIVKRNFERENYSSHNWRERNKKKKKKEGNVFKKFKFFRVFLFIMNSKKVGGGRLRKRGGNVKSLIQHVKKSLPPTLAGWRNCPERVVKERGEQRLTQEKTQISVSTEQLDLF